MSFSHWLCALVATALLSGCAANPGSDDSPWGDASMFEGASKIASVPAASIDD